MMSFRRRADASNDPCADHGMPPAMNMDAVARMREQEEQALVKYEMEYSRKKREALLLQWKRDLETAKKNGYVQEQYAPPLRFPEPLAGMRRSPHTGHIMADQPRKRGF